VVAPWLIEVKVPTAYIMPPQSTSWRICSVDVVVASWGVPASGVADTGPPAAPAGVSPAAPTPTTATTVAAPFHTSHRPTFRIMSSPKHAP
jgi:hypothetical protein